MKPNPGTGIAAVPIQAVPPTNKSPKKWERKNIFPKHNNNPFSTFRPKMCKKKPPTPKKPKRGENGEEKNQKTFNDEAIFDFSEVPPPFCSCSGVARRCYKAGPGGWQSKCCTKTLSEYPLPSSPTKPGKRVTGRKITNGAYRKLLCRVAKEGHDLSQAMDLKNYWAKHGTNKFVIIK
ncbi:hypothetical protein ACJIZ3_004208 [Penstemon smallii]|uniref:GAGA-binding transcriptional activator n=1 Tax=Penstemon smallii TaxID=265156 RepID=A0ABD3S1C9_9LAMI